MRMLAPLLRLRIYLLSYGYEQVDGVTCQHVAFRLLLPRLGRSVSQKKRRMPLQAAPFRVRREAYCSTSITPSALMLTWLVPASTSGAGAESIMAAFIIIPPRAYGCG